MVLHSGLQSEWRAVSPPQVWGPAVGSRDRQSSAPTVPGSGECACGPPHAGRAHAAPRGATRDPGGCPVPSLHPRLPRRGRSLPPTPDDSYSLSFHQVIGRGGYTPPGPCPLKSGLGRPGCGHCCRRGGPQGFPQPGRALVARVGCFRGLEQPHAGRELLPRRHVPGMDTELGRRCPRAATQGRPGRLPASRRELPRHMALPEGLC